MFYIKDYQVFGGTLVGVAKVSNLEFSDCTKFVSSNN